jgi:PAS domain S-box-containing protein
MPEYRGNRPGTMTTRLSDVAFRLFVESVEDYAIFMLDPEGYIISWNRGAQRAKGYTDEEIIGKHFSIFYTQEDLARDHPAFELRHAMKHGRYEEEGWRLRKDGTRFWANVVITAIRDEHGVLIGFGKVTRNLTERLVQEQQRIELIKEQQARLDAEASSTAKSYFLTTMSHELRTPLNAIIGYVDLLDLGVHGTLNEDQRESLDRVRRSSKHLLGLINDVLNIARVERGTVEYTIAQFPASELLDYAEPLVIPQFIAHEVKLVRHKPVEDADVLADKEKAQQIILNLLTNAYKFTAPGGQVELSVEVRPETVAFAVADTGRGIPQARLENIFEPFVQIDRHLNHESQQGVGLGLSISKDLARGMNGDLTVESEVGVGSTFTLTLPRAL